MDESWDRLREIFETAIERHGEERRAYLEGACGDDPSLRSLVDSLLEADSEAEGFLSRSPLGSPWGDEEPGAGDAAAGSGSAEGAQPGQSDGVAGSTAPGIDGLSENRIGPYRIQRRLGYGGMGVVYLAVRDDDAFRRRVVIKVVRHDRGDPDLLRRLRVERQILASLDHPNVAKLHDGGSLEDGRPYVVMEYVEGMAIDRYCDEQQLSIDQRLVLFQKVCAAVHYAHQNLVVHRDLKPSNILVTAEGEPKLLDFGIAKLLNPEIASHEIEVTATWRRMMTPEYASPEQVRGQLVTTASDIYSLGVLLFKLLTSRRPFDFEGRSPQEIERTLTEGEPPRPSSVVGRGLASATGGGSEGVGEIAEVAQRRRVRPQELGRLLAGDLDSITLKALRSSPQRRYASAERFASDIERYRQGHPVEARRGTLRYRSGKFLRRHRLATGVGALVGGLVLAFTVTTLRQAAEIARERDQARLEVQRKESVLDLLPSILRVADPYVAQGEELTVREALDRSREPLQRRLIDEPELRAEILHTTGRIYENLGLWDRARSDLESALTLRRALHGEGHPEVAETAAALGVVLAEIGEESLADRLSRESVEQLRRREVSPRRMARAINDRVRVLCIAGDYDTAGPLAEEAVEVARQAGDLDQLSQALTNVASVHLSRGENREAAEVYTRSLELLELLNGVDDLGLAPSLGNLGSALRRAGDLEGAERAFRRSLTLQRKGLGEGHPALAPTLNNLAGVEALRGQFSAAETLYRDAVESLRPVAGDDHPRMFFLELQIASMQIRQGQAEEVAATLRSLLPPWRRRLGSGHRFVAKGESILAEALTAMLRYDEAEELLLQSLSALQESGSVDDVAAVVERLRTLYEASGQPEKLEALLAKVAPG